MRASSDGNSEVYEESNGAKDFNTFTAVNAFEAILVFAELKRKEAFFI